MGRVKLISVEEDKPMHKSVINEWRFGMVVHSYEHYKREMEAQVKKLKRVRLVTVNNKLADKIRSIIKRHDEAIKK